MEKSNALAADVGADCECAVVAALRTSALEARTPRGRMCRICSRSEGTAERLCHRRL
jgi:hypothetical protein